MLICDITVATRTPWSWQTRRRTQFESQVAECREVMAGSRKKTKDQQLLDQTIHPRTLTPWTWVLSTSLISKQLMVKNHFTDQKTEAQNHYASGLKSYRKCIIKVGLQHGQEVLHGPPYSVCHICRK